MNLNTINNFGRDLMLNSIKCIEDINDNNSDITDINKLYKTCSKNYVLIQKYAGAIVLINDTFDFEDEEMKNTINEKQSDLLLIENILEKTLVMLKEAYRKRHIK